MDSASRCRLGGLAIGAGLGFAMAHTYLFNLAPVALAVSTLLGMLIGTAVTPRPLRQPGAAALRTRRVRDYVPASVAVTVICSVVAAVVIHQYFKTPLRPSHERLYFSVGVPASLSTTFATIAVIIALTAVLAWRVVRSPQAGATENERAYDEIRRLVAVRTIVHTCAAIVHVTVAAIAFWYADDQLDWRGGGSPTWGIVLSVAGGIVLILAGRDVAGLITPSPTMTAVTGSPNEQLTTPVNA